MAHTITPSALDAIADPCPTTGAASGPRPNIDAPSSPRVNILQAPASLAEQPAMVARLTAIANTAYSAEAGSFWDPVTWVRTNDEEICTIIRRGELSVAWAANSTRAEPEDLVGCVQMKQLDPQTWAFSMLAVDAGYQGAGIGKDLIAFAESRARGGGAQVMRLELLYPDGWESTLKVRTAGWYERLGYRLFGTEDVHGLLKHLVPMLIRPAVLRVYHKAL